jgi:ABC-type polysaccharide/polyol phosphate transport system ATPase subunit
MSDTAASVPQQAIRVEGLTKRYRLYRRPVHRLLDLFGLLPDTGGYYSEHAALANVDLSIGRGEKVAIIGRNGAGKSTLLKTITGIVRPTSGTVTVSGRVSNLLQIGSGFHPDFTGRQNVFASLAHQGVTGADAARVFDDIVDFAEIAEYIDQPMKTYSTGMCSRLMFSSSVIMKPEILIVDEILGVGDAYFAHKSFERMRDLCSRDGTTLLLVTHDIYSALNLCDRFVWIDRGEVKFDGEGKSAIALYESSVKDQEEQWVRQQNRASLAGRPAASQSHVLLRSQNGFALRVPMAIERIDLELVGGRVSSLDVAGGSEGWQLIPQGNLGEVQTVAGRRSRSLETSGSIFHKAEWIAAVAPAEITSARIAYLYPGDDPVDLRIFAADNRVVLADTLGRTDGWEERVIRPGAAGTLDVPKQTSYGSGLARITDVRFLDADGREIVEITHGDRMTVEVSLALLPELTDRLVTFIVGFSRSGSPYSGLVYRSPMQLPDSDRCTVRVDFDEVLLGAGAWMVISAVGEAGLYDKDVVKYFTTDPAWYHMLAERLSLTVLPTGKVQTFGCFALLPASVTVGPAVRAMEEIS